MDLVVSPTIVGFNTQSNGQGGQALAPGQLIDALVLQLLDATTVRLSVSGSTVDVKTLVPLEPGTAVRLAVRGHGNDTRLVIVGKGGGESDSAAQAGEPAEPPVTIRGPAVQTPDTAVQISGTATGEAGDVVTPARVGDAPQAAPVPVVREADPATALVNATRAAAARQTGLAPVFAEAAAAIDAPGLPPAVRQAAAQLLALRAPFEQGENVTAATVQKAISSAGLFLEARLAVVSRGQTAPPSTSGTPASPNTNTANATPPNVSAADIKADVKAVLLTLRAALKGWLDNAQGLASDIVEPSARAGLAQDDEMVTLAKSLVAEAKVPPPPYRNAPTSGQQPATAPVPPDAPARLIGHALLEETDGALARTTLLQAASLPGAPSAVAEHADAGGTHWNLEVPFMTPMGTAIAHFEISRDEHKAAAAERRPPGWRVNFSVDVEPMGPVHAQISLSGHRAAVRLWAERSPTATALRESVGELSDALKQAALEPAEVVVRDGAPPRPLKPGAGRFVDRAS